MSARAAFPRLDAWRAGGRSFAFAGHDVFHRDSAAPGAGGTLLLVHGFPTSSWDWHALWDTLARRFRVIAPDLLGFGFSAKPRTVAYSFALQADLVEALLAQVGVARVHLLAHDYGDTVAQELLARQAERRRTGGSGLRIDSACLLNGGLFPEAQRPRLIQRVLASPLGPPVARLLTQRTFERSFSAVFGAATQPSAGELAEYWAVVSERDGPLLAPRLLGYLEERRRHRGRWVGALQEADVPIRFVAGLDDPVSGVGMVRRYRELIAQPDVVELAGIGHYPQCEAPQAVLAAFEAFHRDRVSADNGGSL